MLTPEQLESVKKIIRNCKRNHQREVCALIDRVSDYEPQSRVAPSQFLEGYLSQLSVTLKKFEQELKNEVVRVTRIVCPVLGEEEKERILQVLETALEETFYDNRFSIICEALVRHFSRFGIQIDLADYRIDLIESRHAVGVKNKLREINEIIGNELSLLVSKAQVSAQQENSGWLNEVLHLKPSFFGIGINLNYIITKLWRKKN